MCVLLFFFQAEDGIRDLVRSRGLGDVYKRQDVDREPEYFDILLSTAKEKNKMVHCHVDELNLPEEHETELLAQKTIGYGLQGRVVGIHGISLNLSLIHL